MKKIDLIQILISDYEHMIRKIKRSKWLSDTIYSYLCEQNARFGICCFLSSNYNINTDFNWINRNKAMFSSYWGETPCIAYLYGKNILSTLQLRVDILKKELKLCR